ncbi:MAG TPA: ribonuclease P protein component [Terriglobales bacterium]|nr:ribonuclease P protein component [Terriglobales bacterium]
MVHGTESARSQRFPRSVRLLRRADFDQVYRQGRKHFAGHMTVFFRRREQNGGPRVGFTVGKVLGRAVTRNRLRRRLREAVRRRLMLLDAPVDLVIHPKRSALDLDFALLVAETESAFTAIRRLVRQPIET